MMGAQLVSTAKSPWFRRVIAASIVPVCVSLSLTAFAQTAAPSASALTPADAAKIATDAYIYGYPLVTMEYTRRSATNVAAPDGKSAPMGVLNKFRAYPAVDDHRVTAPNADTLYTTAFIDVSKEPYVFKLPDSHGRYYLMPMLSGWTDVFQVPGKRTTGTGAQAYLITGPSFTGSVPAGLKQLKSPTGMVWILGRIYCTGTPSDYAAVHAMQDAMVLEPLYALGKPYTPPAGVVNPAWQSKLSVRDQVNALTPDQYFTLLAQLMVDNPPAAADAPIVAEMAQIGIVPGKPFVASALGADTAAALAAVPKAAFDKIMADYANAGQAKNGWLLTLKTGIYGTEYVQRALITAIGLGANRPQDAIYPTSTGPSPSEHYSGSTVRVMHFAKGQLPPVNGFWSLTMYTPDYFFYQNPLNKYTVSARNSLATNADGSTDLYISHVAPKGVPSSNWLPAPAGAYILMMRLYDSKTTPPTILDGSWAPPAALPKT
jgi:hypothetical protein